MGSTKSASLFPQGGTTILPQLDDTHAAEGMAGDQRVYKTVSNPSQHPNTLSILKARHKPVCELMQDVTELYNDWGGVGGAPSVRTSCEERLLVPDKETEVQRGSVTC